MDRNDIRAFTRGRRRSAHPSPPEGAVVGLRIEEPRPEGRCLSIYNV